jgi:hypothetical protein
MELIEIPAPYCLKQGKVYADQWNLSKEMPDWLLLLTAFDAFNGYTSEASNPVGVE